jgi:hypothetical protein
MRYRSNLMSMAALRRAARRSAVVAAGALLLPLPAHASFLPPEVVDVAATYLAWFVVCVMPVAAIVIFWLVHILPEKVAERRHHPQADAIQCLCLLSLVFGGLLWPIAWLWAYTKPIAYRAAYGTDKHDDYFVTMSARAEAGELSATELQHLREELDAIAAQRPLGAELREARARIAAASPTPLAPPADAATLGGAA